MRRLLLPIVLLLSLVMVACAGGAAPEPVTVEREVEVTRIVEGTPVVETITEEVVVTATPAAVAAGPEVMVICMAQEPPSLNPFETALVTSNVQEATNPDLVGTRSYDYQADYVTALPSPEDGTMTIEEITVSEGDRVYDAATDSIITLTAGMTETFTLNQLEGDPLVVESYDGGELTTVQQTAQFTLVEGLTWEDGEPVTADDSVFGFELFADPDSPGVKYTAERTAAYEALDEQTVLWTSLPGFTSNTYMVNVWQPQPRHVFGDFEMTDLLGNELFNRDPLSWGPYVIEDWVAGQQINLTPNPNWVGGAPPLDELIFRFVPDTNQLVAQLASGECDIGTQDAGFESTFPLIRGFEEQGLLEVQNVAGTVFEHLDFNLQPPPDYTGAAATLVDAEGNLLFQNPDFRRAIAQCIDRQVVIDGATNGAGSPAISYIPPEHPLYPGDDALSIWEFNPEQAVELLVSLGFDELNEEGIRVNDQGQELSFVHSTTNSPQRQLVTQIVQQQLRENCGVETQIDLRPADEFFANTPDAPLTGRRYDLSEFAWLTGVEPPCELYITSQIPTGENGYAGQNYIGFSNPEYDAACNAALQALDEEEKAALNAEALSIWTDQVPSYPLFARAKILVHLPGVEGVIMDPTENNDTWNIEEFDFEGPEEATEDVEEADVEQAEEPAVEEEAEEAADE